LKEFSTSGRPQSSLGQCCLLVTGERCPRAMDAGVFWAFGSPGSVPSNETASIGGPYGRLMPSMMEEVEIKLAARTSKGPVGATCQAVYVARAKTFRWT